MLNTDTIEITKNDFAPLLHWCLIKFIVDPGSRMGIGGRADKIGGFIDRWSNQCVNWVMFNHLLRNEEFNIDPDYFFYSAKSAKKSSAEDSEKRTSFLKSPKLCISKPRSPNVTLGFKIFIPLIIAL